MNDPSAADRPLPAHARLRRWRVFAAVGLLAILAVLAHQAWTAAGSPGRGEWTAYSIVYIPEESEERILPDPTSSAALEERRWERYRLRQAAMVKSRLVLGLALRTQGIKDLAVIKGKDDPIDWLQKNLRVSFPDGEEFMHISVTAGTPQDGEALVKAVTDAYLNEFIEKERRLRLKRLDQIKDLLNKYNLSLSRKQENLLNLRRATEVRPPGELQRQLMELQASARKELWETQAALRRARIRLECLSEKHGGDEVKAEIAKLRDEVRMLEKLEESLQKEVKTVGNEKDVVNLNQADLESLQQEIAQERKVADKLAEEQELLNVKLQEKPRVSLFQEAAASRTR
jgi:hypothetical protein